MLSAYDKCHNRHLALAVSKADAARTHMLDLEPSVDQTSMQHNDGCVMRQVHVIQNSAQKPMTIPGEHRTHGESAHHTYAPNWHVSFRRGDNITNMRQRSHSYVTVTWLQPLRSLQQSVLRAPALMSVTRGNAATHHAQAHI